MSDESSSAAGLAARSQEFRAQGKGDEADELLKQAIELRAAERPAGHESWRPQQIADHFAPVMFTGGPSWAFESVGRSSMADMIEHGLNPTSNVLDIGCGSLRIGYWLINFLQPDRYFGIDPERARVEWGVDYLVGREVADAKRPRFSYTSDMDLSVFGATFDFFVARSIWTHAAREHIVTMLEGFRTHGTADAVFLASYVPAGDGEGYLGEDWVEMPLVAHPFGWIAEQSERLGLKAREVPGDLNDQRWVRVEHAAAGERPMPALRTLPEPAPPAGPGSLVGRLLGRG